MKKEECEGCFTYEKYPTHGCRQCEGLTCPCSVCIVKGMCNTPCEALVHYEMKLIDYIEKGSNHD